MKKEKVVKKSIVESYVGIVIGILMASICIFFAVLAICQLLNGNTEDDDGVVFALLMLSSLTVVFIIAVFASIQVISYNDDAKEFILKPMLFGKTKCIKKADILDVVVYNTAVGWVITSAIVLTTIPFDNLTDNELRGKSSDRLMFILYRKKVLEFIKTFWDGEIELRV